MARAVPSNSESETRQSGRGSQAGGGNGGNRGNKDKDKERTGTGTGTGNTEDGGGKAKETSSGSASGGGSGKQKPTAAEQQYLKDLVARHVTDNHPDKITPKYEPGDFEHYSGEFLRKYKDRFKLDVPDDITLRGYLLGSKLGAKTYSYKRNERGQPSARVMKSELAREVKRHFESMSIKEADCIPRFIYRVKNRKRQFRMQFKRSG